MERKSKRGAMRQWKVVVCVMSDLLGRLTCNTRSQIEGNASLHTYSTQ